MASSAPAPGLSSPPLSQSPSKSADAGAQSTAHANGAQSMASDGLQPPKADGPAPRSAGAPGAQSDGVKPSPAKNQTQSASASSPGAKESAQASYEPKNAKPQSKGSDKSTPKLSFVSRIIHILIPCVGPPAPAPPRAAKINEKAPASAVSNNSSATALKEKQTLKDKDKETLTTNESTAADHSQRHAAEPSTTSLGNTLVTPPQAPQLTPEPSVDPTVIVPPTIKTHTLPEEETEGLTSGAVQPPGSTGEEYVQTHSHTHGQMHDHTSSHLEDGDESDGSYSTEGEDGDEMRVVDELAMDEEEQLILNGGAGIPVGPDGLPRPLLPPLASQHAGRKCLVLDLDETLVHSSFKSIQQADYVVPVEIEYHWHNVYVIKRPGVDNFLKRMGELYEVVVFTASLSKYADPVLDKLDIHHVVSHRLFRESCYNHRGNYVKDLSQLGRPIQDTIILDNSPASYIFHPNNAVPVSSWFNDPHDTELTDLCPFLADMCKVDDVRGVLDGGM